MKLPSFFFYVSSFFSFLTCLLLLFIEFSFIFTTGSLARPSFLVVSLGLYYFFPLLITLYLQVMLYHIMYSIRTSQQNTSISPVLLLLSFVLLLYVTSLAIYSFWLKHFETFLNTQYKFLTFTHIFTISDI